MGMGSNFPGLDAAKSLMALLEDRSPGDRTAAELTTSFVTGVRTKRPRWGFFRSCCTASPTSLAPRGITNSPAAASRAGPGFAIR